MIGTQCFDQYMQGVLPDGMAFLPRFQFEGKLHVLKPDQCLLLKTLCDGLCEAVGFRHFFFPKDDITGDGLGKQVFGQRDAQNSIRGQISFRPFFDGE